LKQTERESALITGTKMLERKQFAERAANERERLMAELESSNVDAILLRDLALDAAKKCFGSKSYK